MCKALVKHWVLETQALQRQATVLKNGSQSSFRVDFKNRAVPESTYLPLKSSQALRYLSCPTPNTPAVCTADGSAG